MDANALAFVTPQTLRKNIAESVEFVARLWILAQEIEKKYQDEMVRTIILYNISIIEALLLFWAKKRKKKFLEDKYSHKNNLPDVFQSGNEKELIVAFYCKVPKDDSRIWLHDLIVESKELLGDALRDKVIDLQNIRNTFHLSKARQAVSLSLKKAESSFDVVLEVVNKIKRDLI